ncbi:HEPN domain-containing protein [uncultured Brevundimonas sp.]|uniref:HEPN domain-containing protein n=1 Tax=uncultured Brevundimonas sp. TaxID=213418 RepID=UPI0025CF9021|nr:HEPN domain-containing protein [uncultured Brevundimonas sp.]
MLGGFMAACIIVSPFGIQTDSFPAGTHFGGDHLRFGTLADQHKARIVDYLDFRGEERLSRLVRQKPAFVISHNDIAALRALPDIVTKTDYALQMHEYALGAFQASSVPMASFHFDGEDVTHHAFDARNAGFRPDQEHILGEEVWDRQLAYLEFLYAQSHHAPLARLAINRLCRALRSGANDDGLIDLAIGLEALVITKVEIKFQFALNHSLVGSDDIAERAMTFDLLKGLYDARSTIVHGGAPSRADVRKIDAAKASWPQLQSIAQRSLTYYLLYCSQHDSGAWADHMVHLALGGARVQLEEPQ